MALVNADALELGTTSQAGALGTIRPMRPAPSPSGLSAGERLLTPPKGSPHSKLFPLLFIGRVDYQFTRRRPRRLRSVDWSGSPARRVTLIEGSAFNRQGPGHPLFASSIATIGCYFHTVGSPRPLGFLTSFRSRPHPGPALHWGT